GRGGGRGVGDGGAHRGGGAGGDWRGGRVGRVDRLGHRRRGRGAVVAVAAIHRRYGVRAAGRVGVGHHAGGHPGAVQALAAHIRKIGRASCREGGRAGGGDGADSDGGRRGGLG